MSSDLERYAKTHRCPTCQGKSRLEVRWYLGQYQCYCPLCRSTGPFEKAEKSLYLQWRDNPQSVPVHVANRLADKYEREIDEVLAGLPPDLAGIVEEKYRGLPTPYAGQKREE